MNGVAMSGVTANQAELMESDEHLRSLMEYLEIAKGEQEAAEAASAALKQPEAHRTPLKCYEKQQLPVAASLPEDAKVSVEIHEMLQAANPNPNPSPNLNLSPSLALVLTLTLTLNPAGELREAQRGGEAALRGGVRDGPGAPPDGMRGACGEQRGRSKAMLYQEQAGG